MSDMTPEQEAKFFETGELPPELAAPVETPPAAIEQPTVETPTVETPAPATSTPDPYALLQRQLIDAESRRAATEQQLVDLVSQLQALHAQSTTAAAPDAQTDPIGHMQHQLASVNASIQNLQGNLHAQNAQAAQSAQLQQFIGTVREQRDAFIKTTPDFMDAYAHIRAARANDLRDAGIPESALPAALLQDEMSVASAALAAGKNPAAALYDMAKRHGYVAKAPAPNTALATAQTRLAQVAAGQAAAIAPPRGATEATFTLETLKDASEEDLNKIVQSNDLWNKVAGGRPMGKDIF